MLLYPLVVILDLLLWGLFVDLTARTSEELVMWSAFGLALLVMLWALHEGVKLATARLGQKSTAQGGM